MRIGVSIVIVLLALPLPVARVRAQRATPFADGAHVFLAPQDLGTEKSGGTLSTTPARGISVNGGNREEVRRFFHAVYLASEGTLMNWTGDHATCTAGETSVHYRAAILRRINYFRAMAGVPAGVELSAEYNAAAQEAALMMSVNRALDHTPPPEWECYTADGADAASHSNLYGSGGNSNPIDVYMQDPGDGNREVGHRRWILYPNTRLMGTGDVPAGNGYGSANALWVIDENVFTERATTEHEFIAWPPPGFVPHRVVFGRWSLFYPAADFSAASVTMQRDGQPVEVVLEATINEGINGENGLIWLPMGVDYRHEWAQPDADTTFTVTVQNVRIDGAPRTIDYAVTIFDPAVSTVDPAAAAAALAKPVGGPGSFFTVEGNNYDVGAELDIRINDEHLATVRADDRGRFAVRLDTAGVAPGVFDMTTTPVDAVRAAAEASSDVLFFTLDGAAPLQPPTPPANGANVVEFAVADAFNTSIFLPTIRR